MCVRGDHADGYTRGKRSEELLPVDGKQNPKSSNKRGCVWAGRRHGQRHRKRARGCRKRACEYAKLHTGRANEQKRGEEQQARRNASLSTSCTPVPTELLLDQATLAFWRVLRSKSSWMYLIAPEMTPTSESTIIGWPNNAWRATVGGGGDAHARVGGWVGGWGAQKARPTCYSSRERDGRCPTEKKRRRS